MSKVWVDPPKGWMYGFPAVYDEEVDGEFFSWLVRKGYPSNRIDKDLHVRQWSADDEENPSNS